MKYSKIIIEHFKNPRNQGKIKNADGIGNAGNVVCGDIMRFYLKLKEENGKIIIKDAKFETFGCLVAIANSSILTEMIKGKTIDQALKIKKEDIIKKLGKLPPIKIHCSLLALDAFHEALYDYFKKKKLKIPKIVEETHKRNQKILKEIKKRYKEFLELEKSFLKK